MQNNDNILSVLEQFTLDSVDDISREMAEEFRQRRIEKNMTREDVAEASGVSVSNIVRFEQKGLISLLFSVNETPKWKNLHY